MEAVRELLPDDVVMAVLYKVGTDVRIVADREFARMFGDAALRQPSVFGEFACHPVYEDSAVLRSVLQSLDLGGSIVRENAPARYFRPTEHTAGPYGRLIYEKVPDAMRGAVDHLAERIRDRYAR